VCAIRAMRPPLLQHSAAAATSRAPRARDDTRPF
jgi:hypothetical protein